MPAACRRWGEERRGAWTVSASGAAGGSRTWLGAAPRTQSGVGTKLGRPFPAEVGREAGRPFPGGVGRELGRPCPFGDGMGLGVPDALACAARSVWPWVLAMALMHRPTLCWPSDPGVIPPPDGRYWALHPLGP